MSFYENIPDILAPLTGIAGQGTDYLNLGINIILSTLVGGIVILILMEILGKGWGEHIKIVNAFLMVLIINIINILGVTGLLLPFIAGIPFALFILPLIVWIALMKAFFNELSWKHALIAGIIGYVLSIFIIPQLIAYSRAFIPI